MPTAVSASNLTKAYDLGLERLLVLDHASLQVNVGETVAIVGESGSGKSTFLHIIGGLLRPDSGRLSIEDIDITDMEERQLARMRSEKVGFLFQAFNLLPGETALDNVAVPLWARGLSTKQTYQVAGRALQAVGLKDRMESTPSELSAGERQCVALARTLVGNPTIIFADDPTAGLDGTSKETLLSVCQSLNKAGMTIILTTSDPDVAARCHRVLRLADGKIHDNGSVAGGRVAPTAALPSGVLLERSAGTPRTLCARCNFANTVGGETCERCNFPLQLSEADQEAIRGRLSGTDDRFTGVESTFDQGQVQAGDVMDEFKGVPIFAALGQTNLLKVKAALNPLRFARGATIIKQGDVGDAFYVVRSGNAQVVFEKGQGVQPALVATLGPSEGFDEMALLGDQPRSASVVAVTDVEAWQLSKRAFQVLLSENLSLAIYFNSLAAYRLTMLRQKQAH